MSATPTSFSVNEPSTCVTVQGIGLITGRPITVTLQRAKNEGQGVIFYPGDESAMPIPARLESVVNTDRGVTLANRNGQTLSIVEHFLAATAMTGVSNLNVLVEGAPELPILEGSAIQWLEPLRQLYPETMHPKATRSLKQAVYYRADGDIAIYAIPAEHFAITYAVDFEHDALKMRWARWDSVKDPIELLAQAGTFGHLSELPALQARGLAMGVQEDNTLGLMDNGEYTRPLRQVDEPIYHKMIDLIGDISLSGINLLTLKAHVFAINAGHSSHIPFAKRLVAALQ